MSKYTLEMRRLISTYGEDEVKSWFNQWKFSDYLDQDQINTINSRGIWNTEELLDMILDEYYMREIGFETPDYFAQRAKVLMKQIMEQKAQLIWTAAIKYDPLVNVDYKETFERSYEDENKTEGTANSTSNRNGSGLTVNSDTPQGEISRSAILQGSYASQTQANESEAEVSDESTTTGNHTGEGSEEYTKHIKGNSGVSATAQAMVKQSRQVIITIMTDIVYELAPLFMSIY